MDNSFVILMDKKDNAVGIIARLDIKNNPYRYTCWIKEIYQDAHSHLIKQKVISL